MCRAKTSLQIDRTEYRVGDKVLINIPEDQMAKQGETDTSPQEKIETVLRRINIDEDCITLWFSKNNFASKSIYEDYDVIVHFLWKETLNSCIDNLNIEHINELRKEKTYE